MPLETQVSSSLLRSTPGMLLPVIPGSSPGEKLILNLSRKDTDVY